MPKITSYDDPSGKTGRLYIVRRLRFVRRVKKIDLHQIRGCITTSKYIIPDESASWRRRSGTEDRRDELSEANP